MNYDHLSFKNDVLGRKTFVENLMGVINEWNEIKHENDSLVMSLDSPWGSGKSYLLNMWKNWLISDKDYNEKYYVTYYNAWENDDCENSFIPLVYKLQDMDLYEKDNKMIENLKSKSMDFLKYCGAAFIKDSIKKAIGEETANILTQGIDGAVKAVPKSFFDKYRSYINEKKKFTDSLLNLIPDNGKLIVFVDELDRCRPTFAVETLEIVKHYFNIKNIVFVFAVDLEQLAHSIATMYGNGMDSAGYLRRFFDINVNIPSGDSKQYVETILKDNVNNLGISESFIDIASNIYIKLNLSLRDIDKVTNNFIVFCLFYKNVIEDIKRTEGINNITAGINNILEVYLYFMTLKYKYPSIYTLILKQQFVAYDNSPKNWPVLEMKYFVSANISVVLKNMQTGGTHQKDGSLILKHGINGLNSDGLSFSEHIERTIEMFS